jgi:hypothetical protein
MYKNFTEQQLEKELKRYEQQLQSLEAKIYPKEQQESRQLLLKFYSEKIAELTTILERQKIENFEVRDPYIFKNTPT